MYPLGSQTSVKKADPFGPCGSGPLSLSPVPAALLLLEKLLQGEVRLSANPYDWLGAGFYIWQDAPYRALEWAQQQHGPDAAAVAVRISLERCVDLLDPRWQERLAEADDQYVLERL